MGRLIDLTGKTFGFLTVLKKSSEKKNNEVMWECQCTCGNLILVKGRNLRDGNTTSCGCSRQKANDLTGQQFHRLTVLYPTKDRTTDRCIIYHCKCECGKECDVSSKHLRQEITKSCGCLNTETRQQLGHNNKIDLIGQKFGELIVLEDSGERYQGNVLWRCQCSCGNTPLIKGTSLLHGVQSCGCIKSKGEQKISTLLKENNIPFETQKTFESCRFPNSNYKAKFDFYVNNQYLIEYDGEQHFKYRNEGWNNQSNFEKTKERDEYKNQWCQDNNIPLIRISYTQLKDLTIQDLIYKEGD